MWRIIRDPNIRILIYSDSAGKAEGFLSDIKNHILGKAGNSVFREYFPNYETEARQGKWNESQITVRIRDSHRKEPTIDTGGIESSKTGMHYDLILFDDIVSDINATTKAQMDKVWECYQKSLSLLKPGGDIVMTGTRWNFGDSYGRILEENRDTDDWGIFIKQAIVNDTYPFEMVGLNKEFLEKQKNRQGSYIFSCLYLNSPVDDSTALFKHDDFKFYPPNTDFNNLYITCVCDPAGQGADYTAFTVVGTDSEMRMFILYAKQGHMQPSTIIEETIRLSYQFKFVKFGIETNLFEGMLEKEIKTRIAEEKSNPKFNMFSVELFSSKGTSHKGKDYRIRSLQPYHERGDLLFPGESVERLGGAYAELASQMLQYTESHKPMHDDLLDSLAFHVSLSRQGGGSVKVKPPENSIQGFYEREIANMNRLQSRVPRRFRKQYVSCYA